LGFLECFKLSCQALFRVRHGDCYKGSRSRL
jgi:hypothetical protein